MTSWSCHLDGIYGVTELRLSVPEAGKRLLSSRSRAAAGVATSTVTSAAGTTNPQVERWGGQDSNLRPEDHESPALTD
jgi:hypothetical protein